MVENPLGPFQNRYAIEPFIVTHEIIHYHVLYQRTYILSTFFGYIQLYFPRSSCRCTAKQRAKKKGLQDRQA